MGGATRGGRRGSKPTTNSKSDGGTAKGVLSMKNKGNKDANANPSPLLVQPTDNPNKSQVFSVLTGAPNLPTPPPSVVDVGSVLVSTSTIGDENQSRLFFEACRRNGRMENEVMLAKDLSSYVRYELFPRLKFIMSNSQLNFSTEKNTICGLICADMGLLDAKASVPWWENYKDMIADVLNAKRADVTGAIKRVFMRKLNRILFQKQRCYLLL
jgi:hypothetical protein